MADNSELEKIERTKKKLLAAFVEYSKVQNKIEAMRREHRKVEKTSPGLVPHSDWGSWWIKNKWNLAQLKSYADYAGDYAEFIYDAYEINRYICSKFISDAGNYFKHPSDENLKKIQPEFKRVMNIKNQKKLLKEQLFKSLCKEEAVYTEGKNKICCLNVPQAMYNLESQIVAYSEAVESNKGYNKSLEDKLLYEILSSISKYSCPDTIMLDMEPSRRLEIFAFGCGSGVHEYKVVSELIKQRGINEDFVDIYMTDINQAMVEEAVSNSEHLNFKRMREGKKRINVEGFQIDFTKDMRTTFDARWPWARFKMFLFLGSTLGNFDSNEQKRILGNICDVMDSDFGGDLIVGVKGIHYQDGKPDKEKMEEEYASGAKFIYDPLKILGIERSCLGKYKAEFSFDKNKNIHDMVVLFPVIQDTAVILGKERYNFFKGDIIKVAHSQRFTKDELNGLASYGALKPLEVIDKNGYIAGVYHKK